MPPTALRLFVPLVISIAVAGGCIEKRPRKREGATARAATSSAPKQASPDAVDDRLAHLVEGDRYRVPVGAADPWQGAGDPLVTIVEYSDFECPFCGQLASNIAAALERYPDDVRLVFKQFPLAMHARAEPAARAAVAAGAQGKFWEMHDALFGDRGKLGDNDLVAHATAIGLDVAAWKSAYADPTTARKVADELAEGRALEVSSTPTFFVNGRKVTGAKNVETLSQIIEEERAMALRLVAAGAARSEVYARIFRAAKLGAAPVKAEAPPPTPAPTADPAHKRGEPSKIPNYAIPVGAATPTRGPADAPVTVIAFVAYGCADCQAALGELAKLATSHPELRIAIRQMPATDDKAQNAAAGAAVAAAAQGKFWELHEQLAAATTLDPIGVLRLAGGVGLDTSRLQKDLAAELTTRILTEDAAVANTTRGTQTAPFFFVNGRFADGRATASDLAALAAEETGKATAFAKDKRVAANDLYAAMRKTWRGVALVDAVPQLTAGDVGR